MTRRRYHVVDKMYGYLPDSLYHVGNKKDALRSTAETVRDYRESGMIAQGRQGDYSLGWRDTDGRVTMGGYFRHVFVEPCDDPSCEDDE